MILGNLIGIGWWLWHYYAVQWCTCCVWRLQLIVHSWTATCALWRDLSSGPGRKSTWATNDGLERLTMVRETWPGRRWLPGYMHWLMCDEYNSAYLDLLCLCWLLWTVGSYGSNCCNTLTYLEFCLRSWNIGIVSVMRLMASSNPFFASHWYWGWWKGRESV